MTVGTRPVFFILQVGLISLSGRGLMMRSEVQNDILQVIIAMEWLQLKMALGMQWWIYATKDKEAIPIMDLSHAGLDKNCLLAIFASVG